MDLDYYYNITIDFLYNKCIFCDVLCLKIISLQCGHSICIDCFIDNKICIICCPIKNIKKLVYKPFHKKVEWYNPFYEYSDDDLDNNVYDDLNNDLKTIITIKKLQYKPFMRKVEWYSPFYEYSDDE